jgi:hypothetical protein
VSRDINNDISYVRANLGSANPVSPGSGLAPAAPASAGLDGSAELPLPFLGIGAGSSRRRGPVFAAAGLVAVALVAVAVAVTAGQSKPSGQVVTASGPGAKAITAAFSTTQQARSAKATFSATAGRYRVTGSAVGDLVTGDGELTTDLPAPLGQVQAISAGGFYYLQVPKMLQAVDGGKPWAKIDQATVQQLLGRQLGVPSMAAVLDPSRALDLLKSVSGTVTSMGSETLPGDSTPSTHYRATVDLAKVAAGAPAEGVPADLWLDQQGRLRKLTLSFDLNEIQLPTGTDASKVPQGTATATLELTDYGTPVNVTAPAADQVGDLGPLSSLIAGG